VLVASGSPDAPPERWRVLTGISSGGRVEVLPDWTAAKPSSGNPSASRRPGRTGLLPLCRAAIEATMIEIADIRKTYPMGSVEVRALRGCRCASNGGIRGDHGAVRVRQVHAHAHPGPPRRAGLGSYRLDGREVRDLGEDERAAFRARAIGFVFQQFNCCPA